MIAGRAYAEQRARGKTSLRRLRNKEKAGKKEG